MNRQHDVHRTVDDWPDCNAGLVIVGRPATHRCVDLAGFARRESCASGESVGGNVAAYCRAARRHDIPGPMALQRASASVPRQPAPEDMPFKVSFHRRSGAFGARSGTWQGNVPPRILRVHSKERSDFGPFIWVPHMIPSKVSIAHCW